MRKTRRCNIILDKMSSLVVDWYYVLLLWKQNASRLNSRKLRISLRNSYLGL